jgi:hypothetical protein
MPGVDRKSKTASKSRGVSRHQSGCKSLVPEPLKAVKSKLPRLLVRKMCDADLEEFYRRQTRCCGYAFVTSRAHNSRRTSEPSQPETAPELTRTSYMGNTCHPVDKRMIKALAVWHLTCDVFTLLTYYRDWSTIGNVIL